MRVNPYTELLRGVWLFERCNSKELATVASAATSLRAPSGRVLAQEGGIGREFFVIVTGRAAVTRNRVDIGGLEPGSFFGEMSLLDRRPRTATVTACEATEVLVLTSRAFTDVVSSMPSVDRKMLTVLAGRLRDLEERFLPVERYGTADAGRQLASR